jgi:hypothetical protein
MVSDIFARRPDRAPYPTAAHIGYVYLGEVTPKLRSCGDTEMSEFGKGARFRKRKDLLDQLFTIMVERGILGRRTKLGMYASITYFVPGPAIGTDIGSVTLHESMELLPEGMVEADLPLLRDLVNVRRTLAIDEHCPVSHIINATGLYGIVKRKPRTPGEMCSLAGFSSAKADKYGAFFADAVLRHDAAEQLDRNERELDSAKAQRPKA